MEEELTAKIDVNNKHDQYTVAVAKYDWVVGGHDYPGIYLRPGVYFYSMNEFTWPLFETGAYSKEAFVWEYTVFF